MTEAWLATESFDEDGKPCPAAGLSEEDIDAAHESEVTWLVEPLRAGSVLKFCGTLNRKSQAPAGRLAATVDAFVHFVYYYSQQSMVLCDVQSMCFVSNCFPKLLN